jgi:hypothetical protein
MEGQVYDQNHATMQPILGRLRQMVNLVVIVVGFSHCLSVTVPNQRAAVKFQLVGW